jgi:hypothetical protein
VIHPPAAVRTRKQLLLERLDEIGRCLERTGHALALIGLGSAGAERDRMDEYSDLDFFAIVEDGCKQRYLGELDWLDRAQPIAYCFRNTADGYKLLFQDGVFCEFAVFEPAELREVPFCRGRIVWKQAHIEDSIAIPARSAAPPHPRARDWLIGEALTNLYVGLCRHRRGELLSAARCIQGHSVDRVMELAALLYEETPGRADAFANDRRFEQRFPEMAPVLARAVQGYARSPQSAAAVLEFLEQHFDINAAMAGAIREML